MRERRELLALRACDQVRLVRQVAQRRAIDRATRQDDSHDDGQRDADRDRQRNRTEQPRAETVHVEVSLYPAPRTVRIVSGSPIFRRNCATWTSTVRVPPG